MSPMAAGTPGVNVLDLLTECADLALGSLCLVLRAAAGSVQFFMEGAHVLLNLLSLSHQPLLDYTGCRCLSPR